MEKAKALRVLKYIKTNPGVSRGKLIERFELNSNSLCKLFGYNQHKIVCVGKNVDMETKNIHGTICKMKTYIHTYYFKGALSTAIL